MAVVQITAEQVKQQLSALGYSIPEFMIDAYLCKLDSIQECWRRLAMMSAT